MGAYGFSTGALYKTDIPLDERVERFNKLGANAIELGLVSQEELMGFRLIPSIRRGLKRYDYVSIHGPMIGIRYGNDDKTKEIIARLKERCGELPVKGIVLHPDLVEDFEIFDGCGLPFLIENMDGSHSVGTSPEYFERMKRRYSFGFVLDVQHAYEHDPSMGMAREMIDAMGDRLRHMHVSGCSVGENHIPVHMSENRNAIVKILEMGIRVPKIFEGVFSEDIDRTISRELGFIGKYER
jgi:sugar phosphate isomerase/epimerase